MPLIPNDPKYTRTKPHLSLLDVLDALDLAPEEEITFGKYTVDCYVPSMHLAFEADGPMHKEKRDFVRDQYLLMEFKLPVIRLTAEELTGDTELITRNILMNMLEYLYRGSAFERRTKARENGANL